MLSDKPDTKIIWKFNREKERHNFKALHKFNIVCNFNCTSEISEAHLNEEVRSASTWQLAGVWQDKLYQWTETVTSDHKDDNIATVNTRLLQSNWLQILKQLLTQQGI